MLKKYYLNLIKNNHPDIKWDSVKLIQKGWSNDVLILDNNLVFRFPKEENTKNNLKKEIQLLNILFKKGITNIPIVLYKNDNLDYFGYKIIPGKELLKKDIINNSNLEILVKQIGDFLTNLHSTPIDNFPFFEKDIQKHYTLDDGYIRYVISNFESIKDKLDKSLYNKIIKFIKDSHPLNIEYLAITHFDFQPKNIIYNNGAKVIQGFIDFSDSGIYDPAIDFMHLYSFSKKLTKLVLKHYKNNFGNILNRAEFYSKKSFIFVLPELINKYPKKIGYYENKLNKLF